MRKRSILASMVALLLLITAPTVKDESAMALDLSLTVRVTIERVRALDTPDELGIGDEAKADFYAVVRIDGEEFESSPISNTNDISPGWEFSKEVNLSAGFVFAEIEIWDKDGFLRFGDDQIDVNPSGGRAHFLTINLSPCTVFGTLTGNCGETITATGDSAPVLGLGGNSAQLDFRVDVIEPPSPPGIAVQCFLSPIWPQPGDTVTITANAVTTTNSRGLDLPGKIADSIEIFVNDSSNAVKERSNAVTTSYSTTVAAGTVSYGCQVRDGGDSDSSGWRTTQVGLPATGEPTDPIAVVFTADRTHALDIVFVADEDSYTGAGDSSFLADVQSVIEGAYYQYDIFLAHQERFNFWIARGTGDADGNAQGCTKLTAGTSAPLWADASAIVHTDRFRDCAGFRVFSSIAVKVGIFLHETGHASFGLDDEYCCDGGYFETRPFPDLYKDRAGCEADAPNVGKTAQDCRGFVEEHVPGVPGDDWFTSDPPHNDLMVDQGDNQALDTRRIEWLFSECEQGRC